MTARDHETLVYRLAQMLVKLNQGEQLDPQSLADEFGVALRTIQRDLNERFAYLPLVKSDGRYKLDPLYLGKLSTRDIERFASLAGVRGLFPSLSDDFLRDIFDSRVQSALLVKGHSYEDITSRRESFRQLESAILARRYIEFDYVRDGESRRYQQVAPYRLINHKGIWYLAGRHDSRLKTFAFGRIERTRVLDEEFVRDSGIDKTLEEEDGIWFGEESREIVLRIAAEVAGYFKRRKLIANQTIEKELEDGSLIVSAKVGHLNQVMPIVRYWIPHIRFISPEALQAELETGLADYLAGRPR